MLGSGTQLAGYRIDSFLAQGGMGVVYRATQVALDRRVALKVIAPELARDEHFRERFKRESRLAAQIEHPNVIPVYEAGEADGQLFIAMRFIDGTDLYTEVQKHGGLEPRRAAGIVLQVGEALDAAHKRGLIHRDVKPANVLLSEGHAYLTDFGLVKDLAGAEGQMTTTGQWVGTPDYVAPEQFKGENVDARADVYALGCVLFHTLTGRVPFPRDQAVAKMWAHSQEDPPRASEFVHVPPQLDDVIARAMAKDPKDRFPSAGDLGRAALAASEGRSAPTEERTVARGEAAPDSTFPKNGHGNATQYAPGAGTARRDDDDDATHAKPPSVTRESRMKRSPVLIIGAVVAALAVVGVVLALVLGGGEEKANPNAGSQPGPIEGDGTDDTPRGPEIASKIEVGGQLRDITAGDGKAWAIGRGGTIVKVDGKSGKLASEFQPYNGGTAIEYTHGAVFAGMRERGHADAQQLVKINKDTDEVEASALTGTRLLGIAGSENAIYITQATDGEVRRFDPKDLRQIGIPAKVKKGPFAITYAFNSLWVTQFGDGATSEYPGGDLLRGSLPVDELSDDSELSFPPTGYAAGDKPWVVAEAAGSIWTATPYDQVMRLDPQRNETLNIAPDAIFSVSDIVGDENRVYISGWKLKGDRKTAAMFVQRLDPVSGKPIGKALDLGDAEDDYGSVLMAMDGDAIYAAAGGNIFKLKL